MLCYYEDRFAYTGIVWKLESSIAPALIFHLGSKELCNSITGNKKNAYFYNLTLNKREDVLVWMYFRDPEHIASRKIY